MADPIYLDGMTLEGGGQLVRIALGISALTGIPLTLSRIRGRRHKGQGLKGQHVTSAMLLGDLCNATAEGLEVKSKDMTFAPSKECFPRIPALGHFEVVDGKQVFTLHAEQQTNGCISLVLQALLPYIVFSGHCLCCGAEKNEEHDEKHVFRLRITGGTDGSLAPSFDYLQEVLCPTLAKAGILVKIGNFRRDSPVHETGFIEFIITPLPQGQSLPAFSLTGRGSITRIELKVMAAEDVEELYAWKSKQQHNELIATLFAPDAVEFIYTFTKTKARAPSTYAIALARTASGYTLASDAHADLPRRGKREKKPTHDAIVERQLERVFAQLRWEVAHGGCVDAHMRDQIAVFQALAAGRSVVDTGAHEGAAGGERVDRTLHARTAEWVLFRMLGVDFDAEGGCEGVALRSGMPYVQRPGRTDAGENGAGEEKWSEGNLRKWGARVGGRVFPRQANCGPCAYWRLEV